MKSKRMEYRSWTRNVKNWMNDERLAGVLMSVCVNEKLNRCGQILLRKSLATLSLCCASVCVLIYSLHRCSSDVTLVKKQCRFDSTSKHRYVHGLHLRAYLVFVNEPKLHSTVRKRSRFRETWIRIRSRDHCNEMSNNWTSNYHRTKRSQMRE